MSRDPIHKTLLECVDLPVPVVALFFLLASAAGDSNDGSITSDSRAQAFQGPDSTGETKLRPAIFIRRLWSGVCSCLLNAVFAQRRCVPGAV